MKLIIEDATMRIIIICLQAIAALGFSHWISSAITAVHDAGKHGDITSGQCYTISMIFSLFFFCWLIVANKRN